MLLKLLALPFTSPIHGATWLATEIRDAADRDMNDPATLRAELTRLEAALEAGDISEQDFEELEDDLISRLQLATRSHA